MMEKEDRDIATTTKAIASIFGAPAGPRQVSSVEENLRNTNNALRQENSSLKIENGNLKAQLERQWGVRRSIALSPPGSPSASSAASSMPASPQLIPRMQQMPEWTFSSPNTNRRVTLELNQLKSKIDTLTREKMDEMRKNYMLAADKYELEGHNIDLQGRLLRGEEQKLWNTMDEHHKALSEAKDALEQELGNALDERDEFARLYQQITDELEETKQELAAEQVKSANLSEEATARAEERHEMEMSFRRMIQDMDAAVQAAQEEKEGLAAKVSALTHDLEVARHNALAVAAERDRAVAEIATREAMEGDNMTGSVYASAISLQNTSMDSHHRRVSMAVREERGRIADEVSALKKERNMLKDALDKATGKRSAELEELQRKTKADKLLLVDKLNGAVRAKDDAEAKASMAVSTCAEQLSAAQQSERTLRQTVERHIAVIAGLEMKIDELQKTNDAIEDARSMLTARNETLEAHVRELSEQQEELSKKTEELVVEKKDLEKRATSLGGKKEAFVVLQRENTALLERKTELEGTSTELRDELTKLKKRLAEKEEVYLKEKVTAEKATAELVEWKQRLAATEELFSDEKRELEREHEEVCAQAKDEAALRAAAEEERNQLNEKVERLTRKTQLLDIQVQTQSQKEATFIDNIKTLQEAVQLAASHVTTVEERAILQHVLTSPERLGMYTLPPLRNPFRRATLASPLGASPMTPHTHVPQLTTPQLRATPPASFYNSYVEGQREGSVESDVPARIFDGFDDPDFSRSARSDGTHTRRESAPGVFDMDADAAAADPVDGAAEAGEDAYAVANDAARDESPPPVASGEEEDGKAVVSSSEDEDDDSAEE